jgi:HlyD family secretion protein
MAIAARPLTCLLARTIMLDTVTATPKDVSSSSAFDIRSILGVGKPASSRFLRWRNLFWAAVVIAIVGLSIEWFLGGSRANVRYTSEPATRGNLTVIVTATGSAQPITQVNISSELSGTVRKVNVDYNSRVTVGQALAELDTDKLKATVHSARAKLDAAKAKVADAAATIEEKLGEYERKKSLAAKQVASDKDLDLAKASYDRAVAQHASALAEVGVAEADLSLNEINLAKACICAPINGIVLKRSVDPGQIVASSLQAPVLFVIAEDLTRMELQVDVDEADVGKVKIGQKAAFSVDAYPDRKFPAEIRDIRFGSETVQGVVTYKAVLAIDNSELLIRPGMTATAEIVVQQVKDALQVTNAALRFSPPSNQPSQQGGGFLKRLLPGLPSSTFRPPSKSEGAGPNRTIWVLHEGVPVAVAVVIGATDGRKTEILKGEIAAGQPIIVDTISLKR